MNNNQALKAAQPPTQQKEQAIEWAPIANGVRLSFLGTSYDAVTAALKDVFGPFPIRLIREQLPILRAMAVVAGEGRLPYQKLMDGVDHFGEIEVRVL